MAGGKFAICGSTASRPDFCPWELNDRSVFPLNQQCKGKTQADRSPLQAPREGEALDQLCLLPELREGIYMQNCPGLHKLLLNLRTENLVLAVCYFARSLCI